MEKTEMVKFPTWIPDCDSQSPAYLDLYISFDASICSAMAFPPLGNSDHVVVSVSIEFLTNLQGDALFLLHSLCQFLCWLGWSSWSVERYFMAGYP